MTLMDKIAVWSFGAAAVAAVASVVMLIRNWNAATTKDLKHVQDNTADTVRTLAEVHNHLASIDLRLNEQNMRAMVDSSVQRVSITVAGSAARGQPLDVTLMLVLEDVTLTQIELFNHNDMKSGEANCTRKDPCNYVAVIHPIMYEPWYFSGKPDHAGAINHILKLRAHLIIVDQRVHRDFVVNLSIGPPPYTDGSMPHQLFVTIEGAS
jgi:hypothetical protein